MSRLANDEIKLDTPEQIARCLACEFDECKNCIRNRKETARMSTDTREKYLPLYHEGLLDREAAERLGCSTSTVARWRHALGLQCNRERTAAKNNRVYPKTITIEEFLQRGKQKNM